MSSFFRSPRRGAGLPSGTEWGLGAAFGRGKGWIQLEMHDRRHIL